MCSLQPNNGAKEEAPPLKVVARSERSFLKSLFKPITSSFSNCTLVSLCQPECRASSTSCAPCGTTRDTARPSRSATSSTWTRDAASSLSTGAAAATTTTLRPWRPAWRRACSQVGAPTPGAAAESFSSHEFRTPCPAGVLVAQEIIVGTEAAVLNWWSSPPPTPLY